MDEKITEKIQAWLDTPKDERDYDEGNLLLLRLSNNRIRYRNFAINAKAKGDIIAYELKKRLAFRLRQVTHQQVETMQAQVDSMPQLNDHTEENERFMAGKRADHDELPAEIQQLYVDNNAIRLKMKEIHLHLRYLSGLHDGSVCPDSDRYPFLKELIQLDKTYRANWQSYDRYVIGVQAP